MISFKNVKKIINNIVVLKDITFTIDNNSIVSFVGETNTGKTALTRIFANPKEIDSGEIILKNDNSKDLKVSVLFDSFEKELNMTVYEYLSFYIDCYNICEDKDYIINNLLSKYKLTILKNANIDTLNINVKKIINLIRILIPKPDVLVLDDPLKSISPIEKNIIKNILIECKKNMTVIFTTNNPQELSDICTHIGILENGELIKFGKIIDILKNLNLLSKMELKISSNMNEAVNVLKEINIVKELSFDNEKIYFTIDGKKDEKEEILKILITNGIRVNSYKEDMEVFGRIYNSIKNMSNQEILSGETF